MPGKRRDHYGGSYRSRADRLKAEARADPSTRCWRCGRLADPKLGDWTAGHVRDGDPTSPLMPEHAKCNFSAGGKSRFDGFPTSRQW